MVLENVINITNFSYEIQNLKRYFQHKENITNSSHEIQNSKHYFQCEYGIQNPNIIFNPRKLLQISVTKFKTIAVILMCLEILLHKHKAVIKVPGTVKQTVNRK